MENTIFNYGGIPVVMDVSYDYEEDCTKAFHDLNHAETGENITTIDWSPYSCPSDEEVELWLGIGAPRGVYLKGEHHESHHNFNSEVLRLVIEEEAAGKEPTYIIKR